MATSATTTARGDQVLRDFFKALVADILAIWTTQGKVVTDLGTGVLSAPVLAVGPGGKTTAQATKPVFAKVGGTSVYKAAATAMSALVGTLADAKSAVWPFYIDAAGTITTGAKTADAADAAAAFALLPAVPANKAMIGFIIVTNAQGGGTAFTGGTTALDAAGVTTVYVDTVGVGVAQTSSAPAALTTIV